MEIVYQKKWLMTLWTKWNVCKPASMLLDQTIQVENPGVEILNMVLNFLQNPMIDTLKICKPIICNTQKTDPLQVYVQ